MCLQQVRTYSIINTDCCQTNFKSQNTSIDINIHQEKERKRTLLSISSDCSAGSNSWNHEGWLHERMQQNKLESRSEVCTVWAHLSRRMFRDPRSFALFNINVVLCESKSGGSGLMQLGLRAGDGWMFSNMLWAGSHTIGAGVSRRQINRNHDISDWF